VARSCTCSTCGATIRPRDRDMSLGAAVRLHYWRKHREVMLGRADKRSGKKRTG
jgi:hypothetical protein